MAQILTSPPPQRPPPGGPAEVEGREETKSEINDGSQMNDRDTQERSSGPYPSQSTRYCHPRPRLRESMIRRTVQIGCPDRPGWVVGVRPEGKKYWKQKV
ncbi:hypothetical protein XENOCAPTIV_003303 [Xenoophorus captivus]|uniref:Uncharacterized protein n=1 Tax=Xenoophorus captivus TaxID=1517983 RepID=A0ABV0SDS8_9TELE